MAAADGRRRRVLTTWAPVLLVLLLLGGGIASYEYDLGSRWFGTGTTAPPAGRQGEPAAVPPSTGVDVPAPASPAPVAAAEPAEDDGTMAPRRLTRLLAPLLRNPVLGRHVVAAVADLSSGGLVFQQGVSARPASTTKLLTAVAALQVLGPEHRFATRVLLEGHHQVRRVVLVGGGDPYLASKPAMKGEPTYPVRADLRTLATATAQALGAAGIVRVRMAYDDTLFTGPATSPDWEPSYVPDGVVSRITALWADEGHPADGTGRVADPSLTAATYFADELRSAGISVTGQPEAHRAGGGATPLADVESAPLSQIVERMLTVSDNEAAEVLAHQVGLAAVDDASFAGGVAGVRQALTELGVPLEGDVWYDGSGLSRDNRLRPGTLLSLLGLAASADHPELRSVLSGLPVAGFSGSLEYRFADTPPDARGLVRAKTGTLRGTSSLAGVATDQDGTRVAFVLMADRIKLPRELAARDALDAAAAAIAGCHCSTRAPG